MLGDAKVLSVYIVANTPPGCSVCTSRLPDEADGDDDDDDDDNDADDVADAVIFGANQEVSSAALAPLPTCCNLPTAACPVYGSSSTLRHSRVVSARALPNLSRG